MLWKIFFFFSSRRRHTRLQGDWSSDVCSSDLTSASRHPGVLNSRRCSTASVSRVRLRVRSPPRADRKSTRLNSSHLVISYAVFCLKKKKTKSEKKFYELWKYDNQPHKYKHSQL